MSDIEINGKSAVAISSNLRTISLKPWIKAGSHIVFFYLVVTLLCVVNSLLNATALHSLRLWSDCFDQLDLTEYKHDLRLVLAICIFNVLSCCLIFGISNYISASPLATHTVAWLCTSANLIQLGAGFAQPSKSSWKSNGTRCKILALICGNSVLALSSVRSGTIP